MPHYTLFGPSCLPAFFFDFKKKVLTYNRQFNGESISRRRGDFALRQLLVLGLTYHKTGQPGLSCQKFIASASGNGVRVVNGLVNGIVIRVVYARRTAETGLRLPSRTPFRICHKTHNVLYSAKTKVESGERQWLSAIKKPGIS